MTPAERRTAAAISAELARLVRYDDESIVHEAWIRQRYDGGFAASYAPARSAAVRTAADRLQSWTLPSVEELRAWLAAWRDDGGDARRFRAGIGAMFGADEAAAWRYSERLLTPLRPRIRDLARGMLVHPRHLPYAVAAAVAGFGAGDGRPTATGPPAGRGSRSRAATSRNMGA